MWQFCTNTTCKNTFLNKKHFFRLRTQSGFCIEIMQKWYWVTLPVQHEQKQKNTFSEKKYAAIVAFYFFRFLIFFCDDFVKRFKVSLPTVLVLVKPVTKTDIGLCICFGRTLLFLCFFLCSECENISKPLRRFFRKKCLLHLKKIFFSYIPEKRKK